VTTRTFKNTLNNYSESVSTGASAAGAFFIGPLYFMVKGCWVQGILLFIALFSVFLSPGLIIVYLPIHLALTFFAEDIIAKNYLKKGWVEVTPSKPEKNPLDEANVSRWEENTGPATNTSATKDSKDTFGNNATLLGLIIFAGLFIVFASTR
jgi:hypothetical protein